MSLLYAIIALPLLLGLFFPLIVALWTDWFPLWLGAVITATGMAMTVGLAGWVATFISIFVISAAMMVGAYWYAPASPRNV